MRGLIPITWWKKNSWLKDFIRCVYNNHAVALGLVKALVTQCLYAVKLCVLIRAMSFKSKGICTTKSRIFILSIV